MAYTAVPTRYPEDRSIIASAQNQSLTISGLNGDTDGDYQVDFDLDCSTNAPGPIEIRPNGLTASLESQIVYASGLSAPGGTNKTTWEVTGNGGTCKAAGTFFINSKTGRPRFIQGQAINDTGATLLQYTMTGLWLDTSTVITSLVIRAANVNAFNTGSSFRVRALKKV
jgi:hypothetical protein